MSIEERQRSWLAELDRGMRAEQAAQRENIEQLWADPLEDRLRQGRTLGPLAVGASDGRTTTLKVERSSAALHESVLREGDLVRLSRDAPARPVGHFFFLGEDAEGIHLHCWKGGAETLHGKGWTIDPDYFDLTSRFLDAIEALGATALGRERIMPLLMGSVDATLDAGSYEDTIGELDEEVAAGQAAWHPSQEEAIASCVAAHDAFLVQGPPGTGKTHVLAEVARRLTAAGQCLLVTGPTHRAIDQALGAIQAVLPPTVRVAKIGPRLVGASAVECYETYGESGLAESGRPHVIGATPYALWSPHTGLCAAAFDTVLLDEASQLTPLLAAMAMLRGEKWLFFGDDCQLPPVVLAADDTSPRLRSVFGLLKHRDFDCLLEETWRLNAALCAWPSAAFYHNRLISRHDRRLVLAPPADHPALGPDPALALVTGNQPKATVCNDEEAQEAVELVRLLVRGGVAPEEIGIVTPFRAQAARIRTILRIGPEPGGLHRRVVCDTVERFQGQERDVMVLSFVSSHYPFIEERADFLLQRERLNVAVTRARLKTIVLASRQLLSAAEELAAAGHDGGACFASLVKHLRKASVS